MKCTFLTWTNDDGLDNIDKSNLFIHTRNIHFLRLNIATDNSTARIKGYNEIYSYRRVNQNDQ